MARCQRIITPEYLARIMHGDEIFAATVA